MKAMKDFLRHLWGCHCFFVEMRRPYTGGWSPRFPQRYAKAYLRFMALSLRDRVFLRCFDCTGLRLPLPGPWQAELWWCPKGSVIPEHTHAAFDSRLVFLGGDMEWSLGNWGRGFYGAGVACRKKRLTWRNLFKTIRVGRFQPHGARTLGRFGLFLNLERWTGPKTSAAHDLELA